MSEPEIESRRPRVLVVEDQRHVRAMLCDLLAAWGFDADGVAGAADALERLDADAYNVLLTDLAMPGMSGLELLERVRARDAALGVIVLTASAADLRLERQRLGFTLLRKPLGIEGLRTALGAAAHALR